METSIGWIDRWPVRRAAQALAALGLTPRSRGNVETVQMTNLPDAVAALLLDLELTEAERASINPFELIELELPDLMHPCPVWAEHGAVLVAHFVKRNPGRRPSRWWTYDAPRQPMGTFPGWWCDGKFEQPRLRLGGVGTPAHEVLNVGPRHHYGIPAEWVGGENREWLTADGIDAVPIDPADPPRLR